MNLAISGSSSDDGGGNPGDEFEVKSYSDTPSKVSTERRH